MTAPLNENTHVKAINFVKVNIDSPGSGDRFLPRLGVGAAEDGAGALVGRDLAEESADFFEFLAWGRARR